MKIVSKQETSAPVIDEISLSKQNLSLLCLTLEYKLNCIGTKHVLRRGRIVNFI